MPRAKKKTKLKKPAVKSTKKLTKKPAKATKKKPKAKSKTKAKAKSKSKTKKVLAIPRGYNNVTPYLIVNQAADAIAFYKEVFGAKEMLRVDQANGKVGHAELKIGDSKVMLADVCMEMNAQSPKEYGGSPVGIHLYIKNVDEVVQRAVAAGAKLTRAVENMFYGDRSGEIEDPYGHKWHIATHVEDVSFNEMKKRAAQMYSDN